MKTTAFGFAYLALATLLGAFGAHALKDTLSEASMATFHTGHEYHAMAALVLVAYGLGSGLWPMVNLKAPALLLCIGSIIFSGSLYALSVTGIRILGAITPIGGVLMILSLILAAWKLAKERPI